MESVVTGHDNFKEVRFLLAPSGAHQELKPLSLKRSKFEITNIKANLCYTLSIVTIIVIVLTGIACSVSFIMNKH